MYTVREDEGPREVCIELSAGTMLARSVVVTLSTMDSSARGEAHKFQI